MNYNSLTILHIAGIDECLFRGTSVVVPQHVNAHSKICKVAFVNINNLKIKSIENQFEYKDDLLDIPEPFNNPDLVVFHEVYKIEYIKIYKLLKKRNIPYVIIPHGELSTEAQHHKYLKKMMGNFILFNKFIKNACAIQALSKRELEATKFSTYKFVGTNGVTIPKENKNTFNEDKLIFTYIGRLDAYHKGLDLLIEGVSNIKNELVEKCEIHIYGPDILGRKENLINLIKKYEVGDLIQLHDEVFDEKKRNILLESDVFIQTSRFEGMPLGILEALSYGIPCLITEGTTLTEFVKQEAGWSCETDAKSIGLTIKKAIEEKRLLNQKSQWAKKICEKYFSWENVSRSTLEEYVKIIKRTKK